MGMMENKMETTIISYIGATFRFRYHRPLLPDVNFHSCI